MKKPRKILVTGVDGFLGSHLVDLLSKHYQIIGISQHFSKSTNNFKIIKSDVRKISFKLIPKDIDCVIHLAAITDVKYCQDNPIECFDVNVKGTQNLLEISKKLNAKFIFLSSSHVYGMPTKNPISEIHPRNPISVYASSKFAAEILCESYARNYNLSLIILRLFSVYGPNSPKHLVTSRIISQMMTSDTIKLGNLKPKRDFIYVTDAVHAIELVIRKSQGFNIYNIGSGKSYSIDTICKLLTKMSTKKIQTSSIPTFVRKNDILNMTSDSTQLRKLGWKPKISIEEGLKLTYNYMDNRD